MTTTATDDAPHDPEAFLASIKQFEGVALGAEERAPDDVNAAMIRHWCAALGDTNPVYVDDEAAKANGFDGIVAPPTMLQAWVMAPGPGAPRRGGDDPQAQLMALLEGAGFKSVVATNCEQEYVRYLRPGDRLTMRKTIDSVSEEKTTGLGVGHFVTTRQSYYDAAGELVGSMLFRILKFRPHPKKSAKTEAPEKPPRPRPGITHDNRFFFDGTKDGKLLIQRCQTCGQLRHPPGPMCRNCRGLTWDHVEASGRGTIYSFVVTHYPQVPAFDYPLPIVLVELEEGVRMVMNVLDAEPDDVRIGLPVTIELVDVDPDLTLPHARIATG
jgi:uncharacterized OB-fold protein/acyl dehydratase